MSTGDVDGNVVDGCPRKGGEADSASTEPRTRRERRASERAKRGPVVSFLREVVIVLVSALVISLVLKTFLIQPFYIPSQSMETTLDIGDRIVVNKLAPGPFELDRGDIVVFLDPGNWLSGSQKPELNPAQRVLTWIGLLPENAGEHLVKRIIGLPGDRVVCCNEAGLITVNGVPIEETYVIDGAVPSNRPFDVVVPEGNLWMMGDNRPESADSRFNTATNGGFVPIDNVVGRVFVVIWPVGNMTFIQRPESTFEDVPDPS